MNTLVKLVNEWDAYTQQHSAATIEDFCRFYLVKNHSGNSTTKESCPEDQSRLVKSIAMLMASFNLYYRAAMEESSFPFPEAFYFLNVLKKNGKMKKTALIGMLHMEYTTGMEGIRKLTEAGYIIEETDETDKRAKIISLSQRGEEALPEGYTYMSKIAHILFGIMTENAIKLCLQLLEDVVEQNAILSTEFKNTGFEEMYQQIQKTRSISGDTKQSARKVV
ncbi:MarR family transcriptional regulator [Rhodocytophaga rosea]|uniref:MarR family transcriptional regulator n=1 Tax=Rhodocytophaga rosea TaxID=2704465 RepID=A0A6C0GHQ2_9BACT|nr:MarR family winged helix-turn-helix transcriptional regulator [Rhodocytophaga rosea]QHT67233.1 MarR family transcriptional regulator [Rhodocytophaga rosea]